MNVLQIVEAALFASDAPLTAEELARADDTLDEDAVDAAVRELREEYDDEGRAFQIEEIGGGYQILTRSEFAPYLERLDTVRRPPRLSRPALEALAIVAYRQPISRVEVEYIRGVGSTGVLKTLEDRELVEVVDRGEGVGRPFLYGTTDRFLEHFGFDSLESLPRPDELPVILRDRMPIDPREGGEEGPAPGEVEEFEAVGEGPESLDDAVEAVLDDVGRRSGPPDDVR